MLTEREKTLVAVTFCVTLILAPVILLMLLPIAIAAVIVLLFDS